MSEQIIQELIILFKMLEENNYNVDSLKITLPNKKVIVVK